VSSYSISNILPDFVALLKLKYISGSCSFRVEVKNEDKNDVWKQHKQIFGVYEIKAGTVNGKPHYSSIFATGKFGIWHNEYNKLIIGLTNCSSDYGATGGFAYNDNHDNHDCPYGPSFDWFYLDVSKNWQEADEGLTIRSKS
jgi:hypothetical protein